jgi:hypothetical protein
MACGSRPLVGSSRNSTRGRAQQRLRKAQALAHALGVLAHRALAGVGQAHRSSSMAGALRQRRALQAWQRSAGSRGRPGCRRAPRSRAGSRAGGARRESRARPRARRRPDLAAGGRDQAQHHLEQRALAGAVVADQAEDLALGDVQVHAVDGMHAAVMLAHAAQREIAMPGVVTGRGNACHAIDSSLDVRGACAAWGRRPRARAKRETAGPPGAAPARPGWPAAA